MSKVLKCGDLMPGCNFVAEGKDVAEVMAKGAEHAKTAHGMASMPPDLAAKVQAAINDKSATSTPHSPSPLQGGERVNTARPRFASSAGFAGAT